MTREDGDSGGTLTAGLSDTSPAVGDSEAQTFAPGEIVAERYRIVRLLAGGGMGEVYEAEDLLLKERLALKTIRRDAAHDDRMLERFKREIQLARRVTHPNVCRIFDVGFHRDHAFLTMEFLPGETLDRRLRRGGRMTVAQAESIVAQLAAGLEAAHRAGVIHRDFKSANVMLVDEGGATRAVITDFGLARAIAAPSSDVTGNGGIVGSPSYMAPEQVEGGAVTHATDLYALGVVMYEMVTGRLPFCGDSPLAIAVSRLKHDPPPPRHFVTELDPAWDRAIMKCLAMKPAGRFASALELARTLLPGRVAETSSEMIYGRPVRRRRWPYAVAPVAVAALVAAAVIAFRPGGPPPDPVPGKRSVAVLGFKNMSGRSDHDWLSKALAEMLSTELAAGEKLRAVPGENVVRVKRELGLKDEKEYGGGVLEKLGDRLGSDLVLLGWYDVAGSKIRVDLIVQDTRTGRTAARVAEVGTESDLVALVARSGERLRESLSVEATTPWEEARARASLPATSDAARLYAEGLERMRNVECAPARELLEQAVAADPEYVLARAQVAAALNCLGFTAQAREHAERAMQLGKALSPNVKMATEALHAKMSGDYTRALELYRKLFEAEPDNIDYGSMLVHLQLGAGLTDGAKETLEALRRAPLGDHMAVDLVEANVVESVDHDLRRAVEVLRKVEQKARVLNVPTMAGEAQLSMAGLQLELQEWAEAERQAQEGWKTFNAAKDKDGVALAAKLVAMSRLAVGKVNEARSAAEDGLRAAHSVGDARRIPDLINVMIEIAGAQNDLSEAAKLLEDEERLARQSNQRWLEAWILLRRTLLEAERGNLSQARVLLDHLRLVPTEGSGPSFMAKMALVRMLVAEAMGDVTAAKEAVDQIVASLDRDRTPNSTGAMGLVRLLSARLAVSEGKDEEAAALLDQATADLSQSQSREEAVGAVALADALLSRGRFEEAERVFARARNGNNPTYTAFERMWYRMVELRLRAASKGGPAAADAVDKLEDLAAEAAAAGYHYTSLHARLAQGELALRSGQRAVGRTVLSALGKEARRRGFVTLADRAARLMAQYG